MCLNPVFFDHVRREFRTWPTITVMLPCQNNFIRVEILNSVMQKSGEWRDAYVFVAVWVVFSLFETSTPSS